MLLNAYGVPLTPAAAPAAPGKATLPPAGYVLTPAGANPKRPGTAAYAATALYAARPTVAAYLSAAGPRGRANLMYDLARGYVTAAPAGA